MERFHWEISFSMKERIIRFNWGTKRENKKNFYGQRENGQKRAFAQHIHVCLSIGSTPMALHAFVSFVGVGNWVSLAGL